MFEEGTLAYQIIEGRRAENIIEDKLDVEMVEWGSIEYGDDFGSITVTKIPLAHPMSISVANYLRECGFHQVFAKYIEGWECNFSNNYPNGWWKKWTKDDNSNHNRVIIGEADFGYWEVSEFPILWPKSWQENGYVKVVDPPVSIINVT